MARFDLGGRHAGCVCSNGKAATAVLERTSVQNRVRIMSLTEQSQNSVEDEPFSLIVDQYGRLWLQAKIDGLAVAIDLAEKDVAFNIMALSMSDNGFEYRPIPQEHEEADNDDCRLA